VISEKNPSARVGIGGWTYDPWRETFYPPDLKKGGELDYASRKLTSIEINGTFYRTQTPATYRKWAEATRRMSPSTSRTATNIPNSSM
jgi:uncharacterized protein YecE (DUF72 family)